MFVIFPLAALIDQRQCAGSEPAVQARLESLASQWETLVAKSAEKSDKLKEASRQQTYNAGVKDIEFWLGEVCVYVTNGKDVSQSFITNIITKVHIFCDN